MRFEYDASNALLAKWGKRAIRSNYWAGGFAYYLNSYRRAFPRLVAKCHTWMFGGFVKQMFGFSYLIALTSLAALISACAAPKATLAYALFDEPSEKLRVIHLSINKTWEPDETRRDIVGSGLSGLKSAADIPAFDNATQLVCKDKEIAEKVNISFGVQPLGWGAGAPVVEISASCGEYLGIQN